MKVKMIGAAILVLAHLAVTMRATEVADKKTLTLDGARHAISAAVTQAHKNHVEGGQVLAIWAEPIDFAVRAIGNVKALHLRRHGDPVAGVELTRFLALAAK